LKVLFLNPPFITGDLFMKEVGRCGRRSVAGELWPQTGLAYLAAVALRAGCEARIVDAMASRMNLSELIDYTREFAPDLVVANSTTPTFRNDSEAMEALRKTHPAVYAFTGPHVSALPEESLRESGMDLVFINEAEMTLRQVLRKWKDWADIPGLAFRGGSGIVITSQCPAMSILDDLPLPARHLLPNASYTMPFFENEPFATVIPSRGCPWQCTFCRAGKVWGTKVRIREPRNVIEEIRDIRNNLGIRNVVFMTDSLTLDRRWAEAFFDLLIAEPPGFRWICNSRVDAVTPEMLLRMKKAGCILASYGVESANQAILDRAKKKTTPAQAREAIRWTRDAGILSMAYFILGLPGETKGTIEETIQFAREIDPDYVNFHVATPFPGTELYDLALENGWLTTRDWSAFEEEGSAVLSTETLSAEELVAAQKRAMRSFYIRPGRVWKEFRKIRTMGQFKARIKTAWHMVFTLNRRKSP